MVGSVRRLVTSALLLAFLLVPLVPTGAAATRDDPAEGNWYVLHPAWDGSTGSLSTTPNSGTRATPGAESVIFASPALEEPLYLNPARLVQLDLVLKDATDGLTTTSAKCGAPGTQQARVRVGLEAGDEFLAGLAGAVSIRPTPPALPGHVRCTYRMPLETVFVPAGATLRLKVSFEGQAGFPVSLSDPGTELRLPLFTFSEAVYRMPEVVPRMREATGAAAERDAKGLVTFEGPHFPMALLGLAALARSRRQLAVLLVLAVFLAGCAAAPKEPSRDHDEATDRGEVTVYYDEAPREAGGLIGRVTDRYGYPVEGARVALLGTRHATQSDVYGLFGIEEVPGGRYVLRVDKVTFTSLELPVETLPGKLTRLEVVMAFDASVDVGDRPHVHDLWRGETQFTIFQGPVHSQCHTDPRCVRMDAFYTTPRDPDERRLVRPGTSEVEVTIRFDPADACTTQVGLAIQDNTDSNPTNWTYFEARESGRPFRIKTTWEMTDVGHQLYSTWSFKLYPDAARRAECATGLPTWLMPSTQEGDAVFADEVRIVIKRGVLPLEPRHPDRWAGRASVDLVRGSQRTDPGWGAAAPDANVSLFAACMSQSGLPGLPGDPHAVLGPYVPLGPPAHVVPEGTGRVQMYVNQSRPNGVLGQAGYGWILYYKAGDTQLEKYTIGSPVYKRAPDPVVSADGMSRWWTLHLGPMEADGVYNKRSAWSFLLAPDDTHARCRDMYVNAHGGGNTLGVAPLVITVDAHAVRA